jgi:hypothetical protein
MLSGQNYAPSIFHKLLSYVFHPSLGPDAILPFPSFAPIRTRASNNSTGEGGERLRAEKLFPDTLLPANSLFFLTKRGTSPPHPTCSFPSSLLATDLPVLWMVLHQPQWSRLVPCKGRGFLLYSRRAVARRRVHFTTFPAGTARFALHAREVACCGDLACGSRWDAMRSVGVPAWLGRREE